MNDSGNTNQDHSITSKRRKGLSPQQLHRHRAKTDIHNITHQNSQFFVASIECSSSNLRKWDIRVGLEQLNNILTNFLIGFGGETDLWKVPRGVQCQLRTKRKGTHG